MKTTTIEQAIESARALGIEAAIGAASWAVDVNDRDRDNPARTLQLLEDGDPAAFDYLPDAPTLSGEWSNDPTPASLLEDVGLAYPDDYVNGAGSDVDLADVVCSAWEDAVSETFQTACEEELRRAIA